MIVTELQKKIQGLELEIYVEGLKKDKNHGEKRERFHCEGDDDYTYTLPFFSLETSSWL